MVAAGIELTQQQLEASPPAPRTLVDMAASAVVVAAAVAFALAPPDECPSQEEEERIAHAWNQNMAQLA